MAAARTIRVLILNLCLEREPLYGIGEWAERLDPAALGVEPEEVALLCDDRVGRALDQLFDCDRASLLTALVLRAIGEFQVDCSRCTTTRPRSPCTATTAQLTGASGAARAPPPRNAVITRSIAAI